MWKVEWRREGRGDGMEDKKVKMIGGKKLKK